MKPASAGFFIHRDKLLVYPGRNIIMEKREYYYVSPEIFL